MNDYDAEQLADLQTTVSDLEEERDCERERAEESEKEVERLKGHLAFYNEACDSIWAISDLVQRNPGFFGARLGESTMARAAGKLKELVAAGVAAGGDSGGGGGIK